MPNKWLNRDVPIDLRCPECSQQFSKTLRDLESDQAFSCPGFSLEFQPRDFTTDLQAAENKIDDLGRGVKRSMGRGRS